MGYEFYLRTLRPTSTRPWKRRPSRVGVRDGVCVVSLNSGGEALLDGPFLHAARRYAWRGGNGRSGRYVGTMIAGFRVLLHRWVWQIEKGILGPDQKIDHIDRNPLNNRLENLRIVTASLNQANRGRQSNNTSGWVGVRWYKAYGCWYASVKSGGVQHFLGYHKDATVAARIVNDAYRDLFPQVPIPNPAAE